MFKMDEIDIRKRFDDAMAKHMVGKTVRAVYDDGESFEIAFTDGTAIALPYVLAHYTHSEISVFRWDYPEDP